jgi:hypothetical protein
MRSVAIEAAERTRCGFASCAFGILLLSFPLALFGQTKKLNLAEAYPLVQANNVLWIGTPSGLYQYSPADDAYKRFIIPTRLHSQHVKQLLLHNEWLWCVLDTGLAALQVRLNDWLFFDTTNGLPSNHVGNIDVMEDYVWAATDSGLARFDVLIEQWEVFDRTRGLLSPTVLDLRTFNNHVWLAGRRSFSEFNPQFEKWRHFTLDDTATVLKRCLVVGDELWFVATDGLIRFHPQLQTRQTFFLPYLSEQNLIELFLENNVIWSLTKQGLFFYEQQSGVWKTFEGNNFLAGREITGGSITAQQIWLLTRDAVLVWSRDRKNWEILDYSSGLSTTDFESVHADGELALLFKFPHINYRRSVTEPWRKFLLAADPAAGGEDFFRSLFDNPHGGQIAIGDYRWSFQGTRTNFLRDAETKYEPHGTQRATTAAERLDVKSQLELGQGRRITGFYNNVDFAETMYGTRFRGNDKDVVRELNWGDFTRDRGTNPYAEDAEIFGANAWFQYGDKTPRFKRSLIAAKAAAGELRSKKTYEQYSGAATEFSTIVRDVDFVKMQFFSLPGIRPFSSMENVRVFVDDRNPANNTPNTLAGTEIAGVRGDFDEWKPTEDFYSYGKAGVIRLLKNVRSDYVITARYSTEGQVRESVLLSAPVSTAQQNFYVLSAQQIIPYSFQLILRDSSGRVVPLRSFGVDEDGDERFDSQFIDYERGVFFFPSPMPFPPAVYDSAAPRSFYRMSVSYRTEWSLIQLQHSNLVRGSEILRLDGVLAASGGDYVLDYTNGTLIFVREGLVSSATRIEIEYEYYEARDNDLYTASLNYSPSDNFFVQSDWQKTKDDSLNLVSLHTEIRQPLGGFDVKLTPAAAYDIHGRRVTASRVDGLVSSSTFRFQTTYQNFSTAYRNLYHPQAVFGNIRNSLLFFSSYDVRDDLRLSGEWRRSNGYAVAAADQATTAGVLFHHLHLPAVQLTFHDNTTTTSAATQNKWFIQGLADYQIPQPLAESILLSSLRLESYLKYGFQTDETSAMYARLRIMNTYYKLNSIVTDQFQFGFFYRSNTTYEGTGERRLQSNAERLLADLMYAELRAVQVNLRLENTLSQHAHKNSSIRNYTLGQFYQVNVRFSPGQVLDVFSPLFFEMTYNQSLSQSGVREGSAGSYLWSLSPKNLDASESFSLNRTYYIKNEFRSSSQWFLVSTVEWTTNEAGASRSRLDRSAYRISEKLDLKLSAETRLVAEFKHFNQDLSFGRRTRDYEPSLWLEHRWSSELTNTFNLTYRKRNAEDGSITNISNDWTQTIDVLWQKNDFLGIRYFELQQTLGGESHRTRGYAPQRSYRFISGTSVNAYPLQSLIIRLRMDITRNWDNVSATGDYTIVAYSLKLTLQM